MIVHRIERKELLYGDKAGLSGFWVQARSIRRLFTALCLCVFDVKSFRCFSSICAKVFHEKNNIEFMAVLNDSLFASTSNDNKIKIFNFKHFDEIIEDKFLK